MIRNIGEACKMYGINHTPKNTLACLMCSDPWIAEFIEEQPHSWVILYATHQSGKSYYIAVFLKPPNWVEIRKEGFYKDDQPRTCYSYSEDGVFGYRRQTLEEVRTFIKVLNDAKERYAAIDDDDLEDTMVKPDINDKYAMRKYWAFHARKKRLNRKPKAEPRKSDWSEKVD